MYMGVSVQPSEDMMPTYRKPDEIENELHRLLLRAVPMNDHGNKTLLHLSGLIGVSLWGIRKWINSQRLSPARVKQLVEIGKLGDPESLTGRVSREDFERFIYND